MDDDTVRATLNELNVRCKPEDIIRMADDIQNGGNRRKTIITLPKYEGHARRRAAEYIRTKFGDSPPSVIPKPVVIPPPGPVPRTRSEMVARTLLKCLS